MMIAMQIRTASTCYIAVNRMIIWLIWTQRTRLAIKYSNILTGRPRSGSPRARRNITSNAVMRTPAHSGKEGNSKQRAMAEPKSSARSVEIMAISERA